MRIARLTVSASRKLPHPVEEFGSHSSLVSLEVEVADGDDISFIVPSLQSRVDEMVETHLRRVTTQIATRARVEQAAADAKKKTEGAANRLVAKHSKEPF